MLVDAIKRVRNWVIPSRVPPVAPLESYLDIRYRDAFEMPHLSMPRRTTFSVVDSFEAPHHTPIELHFRSLNDDAEVRNADPISAMVRKALDAIRPNSADEIRVDFATGDLAK